MEAFNEAAFSAASADLRASWLVCFPVVEDKDKASRSKVFVVPPEVMVTPGLYRILDAASRLSFLGTVALERRGRG